MNALRGHLRKQIEHSYDFFWHRLRWQAVRSHLPREEPFDLVDVGAGAGLLGEYLERDLPLGRYRFVEPILELEQRLEARWGKQANAAAEPTYAGAGFVCLLDVLEHQPDDRAFARELFDKLEPGATLIVTVPALAMLWSEWDAALGHFRRYDRPMLSQCTAGLPQEQVELSYLFPEMILPGLARKLQRRKDVGTAEFPELPRMVNAAAHALGSITLRGRRRWPAGSSLLGVYRRL